MKATIYHNPMCGTSRKTLEILNNEGVEVDVIEYLKAPPSRDELSRLYDRAGITPRQGLREKEPLAIELGLTDPSISDDQILDAMMEHPILIQRPLVRPKRASACAARRKRCARYCECRKMSDGLDPRILLRGYAAGIFPMADSRNAGDIFWVEPRSRAIIPLDDFHLSRSLAQRSAPANSRHPRPRLS